MNFPLVSYIVFAYKMAESQEQLLTPQLPKWATTDGFDIQASVQGNPTKDQMRVINRDLTVVEILNGLAGSGARVGITRSHAPDRLQLAVSDAGRADPELLKLLEENRSEVRASSSRTRQAAPQDPCRAAHHAPANRHPSPLDPLMA